jgi:hypothetical protein
MIAIGEFHSAVIQLEAQGHTRIRRVEARQRRLRGRVAMHEGEGFHSQGRAHLRADDEIEEFIAR